MPVICSSAPRRLISCVRGMGLPKPLSLNEEHKEYDQYSKKDRSSNRRPAQKFTGSQNLFFASYPVMPFIEPNRALRLG